MSESKPDIIKEMNKEYKALPPDVANRVRSMRSQNDWADGTGLREENQITFHYSHSPLAHNTIGNPVTIYRPMSFHIDPKVPKNEISTIKSRIREEHARLDENHPLKQANYAVVTHSWKKAEDGSLDRLVTPTLYKVKDKLAFNDEEDFEKIGNFPVALGKSKRAKAMCLSRATRRKLQYSANRASASTQP
jgi:hypothetical protein